MPLFGKKPKGPDVGSHYFGPACWCDDYALVPRPGYYALTEDGRSLTDPLISLVCVDDAPGDPHNPACHYEVAGPKDNPQRPARTADGLIVSLEAHDANGRSETSA